MDRLNQLRDRYLELTNQILPSLAERRHLPVRFNHCWQRIVLDNLFGRCWYEVLDRNTPAYKQLNQAQLEQAIALAEALINQPDEYAAELNRSSLGWRKKLKAPSG